MGVELPHACAEPNRRGTVAAVAEVAEVAIAVGWESVAAVVAVRRESVATVVAVGAIVAVAVKRESDAAVIAVAVKRESDAAVIAVAVRRGNRQRQPSSPESAGTRHAG